MPKVGRETGPTKADGTQAPVLEETAGIDVRLLGANADLLVGGQLAVGQDLTVRGAPVPVDTSSQALSMARTHFARARSGGIGATLAFLGDSFTEASNPSKREFRWIDHLARRLNGQRQIRSHYVPIATGAFSSTNTPSDWPGGQQPWTYGGTVTGRVDLGADLHAATLATSATAALPYFGDFVTFVFTKTATGPAAAAVTIDGTSVGTINANGAQASGQLATFGPADGYGAHTVQVTATGAPLVLEGIIVHDGTRFAFGAEFDVIQTLCFGHAGFSTGSFLASTAWATSLANITTVPSVSKSPALIGIELGANDVLASVSAATYTANLVAIMRRLDTAVTAAGGSTLPGYLLILMPTVAATYRAAAYAAIIPFGASRVDVLDIRDFLPGGGAGWGIFDAGNGHPNDAGHLWLAKTIGDYLDGQTAPTAGVPVMRTGGPVIEAADVALGRSSWTESLGATAGQIYDTAGAPDTTVRERRHRVWLEAGSYEARLRYEQRTSNGGTLQVLVGATNAGTQTTAGTDGTIAESVPTGGTNPIAIDTPGTYPVTIRKTSVNGTVRFVRLFLRKTA